MAKRILTGIRTTGSLHIGHYEGALRMWKELQDEDIYECFFLLADIQALTTHSDRPELIEKSVYEVVLDFLAVGLNPKDPKVNFVLQSGVPELTELTAYFTMLVPFSRMEQNPTIKAERQQLGSAVTAGFVIYPISQTADVSAFTPDPNEAGSFLLVPVGEDQIPHLEETNRIVRTFNQRYGKIFLECTPKVGKMGRLVGTDGQGKMSKSLRNIIQLKDSSETVTKVVMSMFTDPKKIRRGDSGHPDDCPVYIYHQTFGNQEDLGQRKAECESGELSCVECKKSLAITLNTLLEPIRQRRILAEQEPIGDYLRDGTARAREIATVTMEAVREAMHLDYPSIFKKGG